jgi:hypothetical protein
MNFISPAALDGNQELNFYWTDPIDAMSAMTRTVARLKYKGIL